MTRKKVEIALILGSTPARASAYTYTDNVCTVGLEQKNAMRKSSSDKVKTKSDAAKIAGTNNGK